MIFLIYLLPVIVGVICSYLPFGWIVALSVVAVLAIAWAVAAVVTTKGEASLVALAMGGMVGVPSAIFLAVMWFRWAFVSFGVVS